MTAFSSVSYTHLAGSGAFPAGDALILIHLHLEEGHPVEQGVERAQRAEPLAERPVEQYACLLYTSRCV